ncbi:transcription initiation factor IIB [Agyrium rufum]|nr:transcription initiation factor IIB [Agyrium rufum]
MATKTLAPSPGALPAPPPNLASEKPEEWVENFNYNLICRECKEFPPNLVEEFSSGDMVCGSCGLVLSDRMIDTRSEWRTFSNDDQANDDPSRVGDGPNMLLNGSQLATEISFGDGAKSRELHRAQNKLNHDKGTKTLLAAYKEIGALCEALTLSKTVSDSAKHLFKMVSDAGTFRGKSQEAIIAGIILIACRQNDVPRTFREINALTKVPKKEIGRTFKALDKFFEEQNLNQKSSIIPGIDNGIKEVGSTRAHELCVRYCSILQLTPRCSLIAEALATKMNDIGALAGRSPLSAAAACIYFASHLMKQPRTAKEIAGVAGVSDGTIRTSYKLLEVEKDRLIDPDWLKGGAGDVSLLPKV